VAPRLYSLKIEDCEKPISGLMLHSFPRERGAEELLLSLLLEAVYTLRSQPLPLEQLHDNLLHRWFVGLDANDHFPVDGTLLHACASHGSLQPVDSQHDDGQNASPSPSPPFQAGNGWGKTDTDAQRRGEKGARREFHGKRFSNLTHRSTYDPDAYPNSG